MNPFKTLVDLIIPRICHICGENLIESEKFICDQCTEKLPVSGYEKYWRNKSGINTDLNPMEQRFAGQLPLDKACAPFFYTRDSAVAALVHDFKYRGFYSLAKELGKRGGEMLMDSGLFDGVDLLLPIPLHWTKRLKRGYNQSEWLARGISEATGIPTANNLKARRSHKTQTSLTSEQRIANTRGIFTVDRPETLEGRKIMIVDDICTTGATILSAGAALTESVRKIRINIFTLGVVSG